VTVDPIATLALAGVAAGGLAQSVTGLGFSLVAAPGLIALLGPSDGVAVVVLLGTLASVLPLFGQWRSVRTRDGGTLLVPTLLATPVVGMLVAGADTASLAVAAGVAVLAGVVALWRGLSWPRIVSIPGAIGTGVASAVLNVIGGVGGPPVGLYAANAGWPPDQARGTLQAFFLVQGVVTVAVIGVAWPSPAMVIALVAGTLAGMWIAPRMPADRARAAVLAVAAFGGLGLVLGNL
jgi:uncharacterized membrane protein YfcA